MLIHTRSRVTFDRFTAFLIEETKGTFPTWLAPTQVEVIPVSSEFQGDYAREVTEKLKEQGIRAELDDRNEKLGYRLREAQTKKVPYTLILGDKEKQDNTISYRLHGQKDTTTVSQSEFVKLMKEEIKEKRRNSK